ncbi:MAG: DUF116 domain-containing protein [Thermodesulfobacteriota bacterium]|nr:DUF116 domain-containing protein [Thermodesulfobacteriota bacterium]
MAFSCLVLTTLAFLLWWVPYVGLSNIHPNLPFLFGLSLGIVILIILTGIVLLTSSVILEREVFFSHKLRGAVVKIVFPILVFVGRILGLSKKKIQQSFVEINNQLVLSQPFKVTPEKLLLLMPHCLQDNECSVRITGDVKNCERCGNCEIKELVELAEENHVELSVATGGTIARRIVVEKRPEMIIAVACERDLTSGIQDSYPIPVYGILNERPYGPCFNTQVDMIKVKDAMKAILNSQM